METDSQWNIECKMTDLKKKVQVSFHVKVSIGRHACHDMSILYVVASNVASELFMAIT